MKKGFTLIELIIMIAIIGILASIIITTVRIGGKDSEGKPISEQEQCKVFKYSSVRDLPAFCVKYYYTGEASQLR